MALEPAKGLQPRHRIRGPIGVFRDTFRSRAISLIVLPLRKCSRRIRPIVSTVSIPPPPALNQSRQPIRPIHRGSILDADPPAQGVKIARRITGSLAERRAFEWNSLCQSGVIYSSFRPSGATRASYSLRSATMNSCRALPCSGNESHPFGSRYFARNSFVPITLATDSRSFVTTGPGVATGTTKTNQAREMNGNPARAFSMPTTSQNTVNRIFLDENDFSCRQTYRRSAPEPPHAFR
jgi:hypothetical protein